MPIPAQYQGRFFYHFTLLDNLPDILRHGFHSPNEQRRLGLLHKSIAIRQIQDRRATMVVTCGPGGVVHDYIPFYLCKRSSMLLYVVNAKNVDQQHLIYLALPISLIDQPHVVYTNASANTDFPPEFFADPQNLRDLDWAAIGSLKWKMATDAKKQARMAEVLIYQNVDVRLIDHIIVWNDSIRTRVQQIYEQAGLPAPPIRANAHHYYTKWPAAPEQSLVTGPYFTKRAFEQTVQQISEAPQAAGARFANIGGLLDALRANMANLPETAELVGLESENEMHVENVGDHTLSVVRALTESNEFAALDDGAKRIAELAAFLHDIGKGPKARWASKGGKQQVDPDHPIKSARMLVRILTQEVVDVEPDEVRVLAKLVCYHDLVGDILGRDRNPEQLEDLAESERDLDMLIALGMADMRAVNAGWYGAQADRVGDLRRQVMEKLNSISGIEE